MIKAQLQEILEKWTPEQRKRFLIGNLLTDFWSGDDYTFEDFNGMMEESGKRWEDLTIGDISIEEEMVPYKVMIPESQYETVVTSLSSGARIRLLLQGGRDRPVAIEASRIHMNDERQEVTMFTRVNHSFDLELTPEVVAQIEYYTDAQCVLPYHDIFIQEVYLRMEQKQPSIEQLLALVAELLDDMDINHWYVKIVRKIGESSYGISTERGM